MLGVEVGTGEATRTSGGAGGSGVGEAAGIFATTGTGVDGGALATADRGEI